MTHTILRTRKIAARTARRIFVVFLALLAFLTPSLVNAAVPVWVVEFEAGTKYETSLETFLFDLFNTLQRREEDFIASFELQKIVKAREDVNKLFQETQEELRNFGWAYDGYPDLRLGREDAADGIPPTISPVKGLRIINDPLEYLAGEPIMNARLYIACAINYVIWDQKGMDLFSVDALGTPFDVPADLQSALQIGEPKSTYGKTTDESIANLMRLKKTMLTYIHFGHWTQSNAAGGASTGLYEEDPTFGNTFDHEDYDRVRPLCDAIMATLRAETPVTAVKDVVIGMQGTQATAEQLARMVRNILGMPMLKRSLIDVNDATYEEIASAFGGGTNSLEELSTVIGENAEAIASNFAAVREASFIAGQGIRPENLYRTHEVLGSAGPGAPGNKRLELNTEYVISPAVILLQKMQAAQQAMFDLAGQGFLYLDSVSTPSTILDRYNLVSTEGNAEEREICNQVGQCALLDSWLKPAAAFRSVVTLDDNSQPQLIGPNETLVGSGLPAPWEDEGSYLNISNEKVQYNTPRRYTVARFLNSTGGRDIAGQDTGGQDEWDGRLPHADNINEKRLGVDYPINDWYDRVFEMYEAGIGTGDAIRQNRNRKFFVKDWQCYVVLWFYDKPPGYQVDSTITEFSAPKVNEYCGFNPIPQP